VELVAREPAVVIDAAHNLASVGALLNTLGESFSPRRSVLIFASTRDKDLKGMLRRLLPRFDEVILTRYRNNPRGVPPEELDVICAQTAAIERSVCADPATAWEEARRRAGPEDLICITGSFFIAAEMRREIDRQPSKPRRWLVGESLSGG
jgi:dihydrofolate synthase/folylpolyglutamate synthase